MSAMEYSGPERRRRPGEDSTRVLIVDDHVLFRVGIAQILSREADLEVVGEAEDARSAMEAALETSPNIILMDRAIGLAKDRPLIALGTAAAAVVVLARNPAVVGAIVSAFVAGASSKPRKS